MVAAPVHETPDTVAALADCDGPDHAGDDIAVVEVTEARTVDSFGCVVPLHRRPLPAVERRHWATVEDTTGTADVVTAPPPLRETPRRGQRQDPEIRAAVVARLAAGETYADIARALGLSVASVRGFMAHQTKQAARTYLARNGASQTDRWLRSPPRSAIGGDWFASLDRVDCGRWIRAAPGRDGPLYDDED